MTTSPTDEFELAAGERTSSDPVEIDMGYESTKFVVGATNTKNEYRLKSIRDPFAFREGKALIWTKVNMTLTGAKKGEEDRKLLQDVWGEVPPCQTTAVMGPSGAGKSSLLNILAGRASSHGRIKLESDIRLDNYRVDPTNMEVRKLIAFVAQDDSLQFTSTPRECIRFSAKLRLPKSTTDTQLDELTDRMLTVLGLSSCADTIVGSALIKGISGGERKRTSVGVELVTKPTMVFLDEPTSGLDSFSAVQLCHVLKMVANAGASVLFTIHQPSSEIFSSFDHLILLNKGRVMYQGSVQGVPDYFAGCGHPTPPNFNPADWIMTVAQVNPKEELDQNGFFPRDTRQLAEAFEPESRAGTNALGMPVFLWSLETTAPLSDQPPGMFTQTWMLFTREMNTIRRDPSALGTRFGITIVFSTLVGAIFFNAGKTSPSVPENLSSHFGALVIVMIMSMFGNAQTALLAFPMERPMFLREYSTNHYSALAYFISRFTVEVCSCALEMLFQASITYAMIGFQASFGLFYVSIFTCTLTTIALAVLVGCFIEDTKLGQEMLNLLVMPQVLFSGFFIAPNMIPVWLRWAQYACTLTYSLRIIMVYEFGNCGTGVKDIIACTNLLDNLNADSDHVWMYWTILMCFFVVFRLSGLYVLKKKATKFL